MSEIQQITDYSENLRLFLEQYKQSEKLKGIVNAANDQADDLEQALFEIRNLIYLETATGAQLDIVGAIFNVDRDGKTDSEYRALIRTVAGLIGSGEPEKIIEALKALYEATFVTYIPAYPAVPAAYYLVTDAVITVPQLEIISAAGVQPYLTSFLVDAVGNNIVDANGNKILVVAT